MKKLNLVSLSMCVVLFAGLGGCAVGLGNDVQLEEHRYISLGQELLDLKKAKDEGILSEAEFLKQKEKLLNKKSSPKRNVIKADIGD